MSSNVFGEDLHNTRDLQTTYYVTDTTQAYDFYWDRESGLRVNIGILDVHLIPEYEDVDHSADSDNEYMMANPHDSDDKLRFQQVIRNYCRSLQPSHCHVAIVSLFHFVLHVLLLINAVAAMCKSCLSDFKLYVHLASYAQSEAQFQPYSQVAGV